MGLLSWGPKFLGWTGRPQFVRVACTPCVGAQLWFAPADTTLVLGQVFEDHPQLSKELIPGVLNLGSGSILFVPAVAGTVYQLFFSLLVPLKPVGRFLRQERDVAGSLPHFLPCSFSLECFAVGFRFICFAFCIPLRF